MMGSLGDPHTTFFPPRAAKAFNDETRANFFGIGARLQPNSGGAKVFTVFEESPAARAGLKAGDLITHVDGVKVSGKAVDAIVDRVKGPEGTMVRLTVQREGEKAPKVITVKRARIFAPTVENVKVLPGANVGYLAMSSFSEPTMSQFTKALGTLEKQPLQGLVIDLRGNGGGLLETARDLLSLFVEDKVVVKMKMRGRKEEVLRTFSNSTRDFRYPVVILVNEESASAAEIFAGCLKDYGRATLVGEHTYGKASVQNVFPLIDRASAKITIAKYMLPATADISRKVDEDGLYVSGGIAPDVEVKLDPNLADFTQGDPKNDPQLQKALEIIAAKR
jgi:carboxyl-terminal processing protease